jgi:hypothetical protein
MKPPAWLTPILARYPRIAIAGGPRTGKSSIASTITDRPVIATDDYMRLPWDDVPRAVIAQASASGARFVVEGVQVTRALRKGLQVDAVVWLDTPHVELTGAQQGMRTGMETVFREWQQMPEGKVVPVFRAPKEGR